jgi:lysozyme family protein
MKDNFQSSLAHVLKSEGGFVNHPKDPGGMTNLGCTKNTWEEYVGHPVSEADMRALTPELVYPLYKRKYWDKVAGDDLPSGLDYAVFSSSFSS